MKKILATAILATLFLTGCGTDAANNVQEKKVDEVKQETAQTVNAVQNQASSTTTHEVLDPKKSIFNETREVPILGLLPGISVEQITSVLGEPVSRDEEDLFFKNGLKVELNDFGNAVEKIKIRSEGIVTPEGLAVGMSEDEIQARYGAADKVDRDHDDGEVEYKYYSRDGRKSFKVTARGGVVAEMESELRD